MTLSPHSFVLGESLEIRDNHGWNVLSKVVLHTMSIHFKVWTVILRQLDGAIRINLSNSEWTSPSGFELSREDLESRVEKKDSITNVKNAVLDF